MVSKGEERKKKTLIIIDGSSLVYRAFHAVPAAFMSPSGIPTNAAYGFTQTLRKILADFHPDYVAIAFDVKGPTFRHAISTDYKAERPPMPDALSIQIPFIKRIVGAFGITGLESESFEADDVIATVARKASAAGIKTAIVTGDKDMYQLVDENTVILDYSTGRESGAAEVVEKFGVGPSLIRDLIALAGDSSDNIPGVRGVGFKTAAKLLNEYGGFDALYADPARVRNEKVRRALVEHRDDAYTSRELATLHYDVPVEWTIERLKTGAPDIAALKAVFKELGFEKLLKELASEGRDAASVTGPAAGTGPAGHARITGATAGADAFEALRGKSARVFVSPLPDDGGGLAGAAVTGGDACWYAPCGEDGGADLLKKLLADAAVEKVTDDSKPLYRWALANGFEAVGIRFDTSLASYVLNPSRSDHSMAALAYEELGVVLPEEEDEGAGACRRASYLPEVAERLFERLGGDAALSKLFAEMEMPLARVLAGMEEAGVKVDASILWGLSKEMDSKITAIRESIYRSAGLEFNISSPKQLSEVLFTKLGLKPVKRTRTGFSTDEDVLTQLAAKHEVPGMILGFRQLAKLKSTYVDALLDIIDTGTGRVHTTFNQTVTATGRLSSSNPNLQNIPVRGEWAGRIREAFVADEGCVFVSADYSQIELRLVAHLSGEERLIEAFNAGEDIHTRTAAEVFAVAPAEVTPELRRRVKAINFGIIYGMGPYGLAGELGITPLEAASYIDGYFTRYSAVKAFIDRTIAEAKRLGFTTTLFGRKRYIPELKSPVEATARFGERMAVNTPIQGSAADMIKAAMLKIDRRLKDEGFKARMLLQIHDELIFESPLKEADAVTALAAEEMAGVVSLKVPVTVNIERGPNWNAVE